MTNKEMNKLADIIVDKIRLLQKEMDETFYTTASTLNEAWGIAAIDPAERQLLQDEYDDVLEQLVLNLSEALAAENYELAAVIQEKIKDLKNRDK
jgi:excinuclease UvrABC helicase subunit UvrB